MNGWSVCNRGVYFIINFMLVYLLDILDFIGEVVVEISELVNVRRIFLV